MFKLVIFLNQTESTPKHFFRKKALVILIAFPMQQCLQQCPSQLHYTHTASKAADFRLLKFNSIIIPKHTVNYLSTTQ
jgi:hypothetical protein